MSFYQTQNIPNFSIKQSNKVSTAIQEHISSIDNNNSSIFYATFTVENNEARIDPINLIDQGYFLVTQISSTMGIQFICSEKYRKVIGTISLNSNYGLIVTKPSMNSVQFTISGISQPMLAMMSFMVEK